MGKKESKYKTIQEIEEKRDLWVKESKEQGMFNGIVDTLTKLYTSSGHFIFELLQNAEDVFATSVTFKLEHDKLIFEHNGKRPFDINDIDSITCIGDSTKKYDDGNSIGKFGIGFKSVFEYTAAPEIHSADYHFCIKELFIPKVIQSIDNFDKSKTIIILPFNGEKDECKCYSEIKESFEQLEAIVLLFLRNIAEINCLYEANKITITRDDTFTEKNCPKNVCRIQRIQTNTEDENETTLLSYKRFFKKISISDNGKLKELTIGIAFLMDYMEDDKKWKIRPIFKDSGRIPNGKIFAYFPCNAEEQRFCFHIHAPFALTVDREKLRDDEANKAVIEEIASLLCESMEELKTDGLIDLELYRTLPNEKNDVYLGMFSEIRTKIKNFFVNNPYILMDDGTYKNGENIYIDFHNIKKLLNNKDISTLYNSAEESIWIKNPMKNQRDHNFLSSLGVREYVITDFLEKLIYIKSESEEKYSSIIKQFEIRDISWFTRLYTLMDSSWKSILEKCNEADLRSLQLCYCNDRKLYSFSNCFLSDSVSEIESSSIHCVNSECLNSKQAEPNLATSFFRTKLGIRDYKLSDMIEELCKEFEEKKDKTLDNTIKLYRFYQEDNSILNILKRHEILCSENNEWKKPENFYLPEEFEGAVKNLSIYYDFYNSELESDQTNYYLYKLNPDYKIYFKDENEFSSFRNFIIELGVEKSIKVQNTRCYSNPNRDIILKEFEAEFGEYISKVPSCHHDDRDYEIKYFKEFLNRPINEAVFELIWTFLMNANQEFKNGFFRPARKYNRKYYPSQIIMDLQDNAWIMQVHDGKTEFVKPKDASRKRLPIKYQNHLDDPNLKDWLSAIKFEQNQQKQDEQQQKENEFLKSRGIEPYLIQTIKELCDTGISNEEINNALINIKSKITIQKLENETEDFDIERIMEKTKEICDDTPDKEFVKKLINIHTGFSKIKDKSAAYLKCRYMSVNNMNCQICNNPMPFKKENGEDYFENVQLFNNSLVPKDIKFNYIALCPVCSAKIKVYFNKEKQKDLYAKIMYSHDTEKSFPIILDKQESILFSEQHIIALRQTIKTLKGQVSC